MLARLATIASMAISTGVVQCDENAPASSPAMNVAR